MSDLISRDALLTRMRDRLIDLGDQYEPDDPYVLGFAGGYEYVNDAPAVDAAPVVHARWVFDRPYHYMCSVCSRMLGVSALTMTYCPYCGSKMDGGDEQ